MVFQDPSSPDNLVIKSLDRFIISSSQVSINLVAQTPKSITKLNRELFNRNGSTDVIAVNQQSAISRQLQAKPKITKSTKSTKLPGSISPSRSLLGDLYICPSVIAANARKYKVSYSEELARIIIHGILHLLGVDHKKSFGESREKMFRMQEMLVDSLKLYI